MAKTILCPYCLHEIPQALARQGKKCTACKREFPGRYLKDYQREPNVVISVVGFSGHGKTTYLASLMWLLQKKLGRYWGSAKRRFIYDPLRADEDFKIMEDHINDLDQSILPEPTQWSTFPKPTVHRLLQIPYLSNWRMIICDTGGEAFNDLKRFGQRASFVQRSSTVLFLVSLPHLKGLDPGLEMGKLLKNYRDGMEGMGADTKKQKLLVVYTLGDALIKNGWLQKYPEISDYIGTGEAKKLDATGMVHYLDGLRKISTELETFTLKKVRADHFFSIGKDEFKDLTFCICSSLGAPPSTEEFIINGKKRSKLTQKINPRRVIDPLLWIIDNACTERNPLKERIEKPIRRL